MAAILPGERTSQPLIPLFVAATVGVTSDRMGNFPLLFWPVLVLCSLGLWSLVRRGGKRVAGSGLVWLAAMGTAGLWHHWQWRWFEAENLGRGARAKSIPVCVDVIALSSPRHYPAPSRDPMNTVHVAEDWRFEVELQQVRNRDTWQECSGRAWVRVSGGTVPIGAGDRLRLFAQLSLSTPPMNPGEVDFREYERAERRLFRLDVDSAHWVRVLARGRRAGLAHLLSRVRDHGHANLGRYLHPARAGLASAVLLGMREQIDRQRTQEYMVTGTIHLLSISGLHVGILAGGFWLLARFGWLSRKKTLVLAVVFVVLYALLTEARPPVVRAAVLVVVMCAARFLGRQAFSGNTLSAAGLVVLVLNPSAFFHVGTQLSFLAVATIAVLPRSSTARAVDPLTRLIAETRPWPVRAARRCVRVAVQAVWLSTAIWLVALPLVAYRFNIVSPVATILNPIVCVPMAVSLFAGLGVMVTGGVLPPLASILGKVCDLSLAAMEWCQEGAVNWWGSHWWTPAPPDWWVLVFYGVSVVWLGWPGLRPPRRWVCAAAVFWFAWGGWLTLGPHGRRAQATDGLQCHLISVGHGTSVLLEFPSGETLLYDAGRLGIASSAARSIAGVLWSRGVTHLDALVISHADADHYNAIPDLLQRFSVGVIYVSPLMFRNESVSLSSLLASIRRTGVPIRELSAGDWLRTGDRTKVEILHPPVTTRSGSDNANSIVMLVEWEGSRVLLPGDLESPGFEELLAQPCVDCDVVMVPHHGSARSDPIAFGKWSSSEHAVISGGAGRDARPVMEAYRSVGARVYHTADTGCVQVELRNGNCRVSTFREIVAPR